MHVMMTTARLTGPAGPVVLAWRDHVVPLLEGRPGFRGFGGLVTEDAMAVTLSVFDRPGAAEEARAAIAEWLAAGQEEPELLQGETVFKHVVDPAEQQKDRHGGLFAVIRRYTGLPGQAEAMHSEASEHTLPAVVEAEGFRGLYTFRDAADTNRAISVSLYTGREEALRAHEAALAAMRETLGEMAYREPRVLMGETAVLVTAS